MGGDAKQRLLDLRVKEISLVDQPANESDFIVMKSVEGLHEIIDKAEWTAAAMNDLPDGAFLYVEPGGEKDEGGKTVPRSLRHFPVKGADGKVDLPHLRNALARIPVSNVPASVKEKLTAEAQRMLEAANKKSKTAKDGMRHDADGDDDGDEDGAEATTKKGAEATQMPDKTTEKTEAEKIAELAKSISALSDALAKKPPLDDAGKASLALLQKAVADLAAPAAAVEKAGKKMSAARVEQLKAALGSMLALLREADPDAYEGLMLDAPGPSEPAGAVPGTGLPEAPLGKGKKTDEPPAWAKTLIEKVESVAPTMDAVNKRLDSIEKGQGVSKALNGDGTDKPVGKRTNFWSGVV